MNIDPANRLLPYQLKWIEDRSRIKIVEKSRRVGITWATAFDCVLDAASNECDCYYIAYSESAAQEFILDCKGWTERLNLIGNIGEDCEHMEDEDGNVIDFAIDKTGIRAFSLTFRSGKRITALSSSPRSLRGKQGRVIIDEAAFHPDLDEVMKAAFSLLIWGRGSRVEVISTHNGIHNPFYRLVEAAKKGESDHSLHTIDFDDAIHDGLYRRICLVNGEEWTEEKQLAWRQQIIREHGTAAEEELFVIPRTGSGEGWFKRSDFILVDSIRDIPGHQVKVDRAIRFWDLAATKPSAVNPDPDYSCGARVLQLSTGDFLIDDIELLREGPGEVHRRILEIAQEDGRDCEVGLWQDPGAAGKADSAAKGRDLTGFTFHAPKASKSKTDFAKPWASIAKQGRLYMLRRDWNDEAFKQLEQFPVATKAHDDVVDAISGAFEVLVNQDAYISSWSKAWTGTW